MFRPTRILVFFSVLTFFYIALVHITPNYAPRISSLYESGTEESDWPNKIWQTWKTHATDLSAEEAERVKTWHDLNPNHRYELLTDAGAEAFVRLHFDQDHLILDTFLALTDNILRADFLRYLILLGEGGVRTLISSLDPSLNRTRSLHVLNPRTNEVPHLPLQQIYTDLDTSCLIPIAAWVPSSTAIPSVDSYSAVVGIENDRPRTEIDWKLYADYSPYIFRLENWTFSSRRNNPFLRHVAHSVARNLIALAASKGASLEDMQVGYRDVVTTTGPVAFTTAFFEYVTKSTGKQWSWQNLTMLEEPVLVADIVVLPIRAMSMVDADLEGEGAHSRNWRSVVRHHSVGTWKAEHPQAGGEKSPEELMAEGVELPG